MRINKTYQDGDDTIKFWEDGFSDESAATYMETYGEGPGFALRHAIGALINPHESVLDVGCGPGWNYEHFLENGPEIEYKGVDYSKRFVRVANQRMLDKGYAWEGEATFQIGDARDLPELNKSWDVVLIQDCLEHTNGYEKPVSEALRVARKRIIITFWRLVETDDPHINDDGSDTYGASYDKRQFEKFLDSLNLHWLHDQIDTGKTRDIYVIDLEAEHGSL